MAEAIALEKGPVDGYVPFMARRAAMVHPECEECYCADLFDAFVHCFCDCH